MITRLLADLVLVVHLLFILFALLGGLLLLWRKWLPLIHLPAAAWAMLVELQGRTCPLTPLENHLRRLAGESGYEGSFIDHYLMAIIYPPGLTPGIQLLLGLLALGVNLLIYGWAVHRLSRRARGA
ncbi:DUF2784 domain-containing protein [Zobellella maritima]|uniref:DUF2784 domain-containing protein n=1 Tax=Zobellella maritima TaxID=2059725 RepID=UPI000E30AB03|nr:DUF2784 domain-containing protein [Zobellella maritima]